MTEAEGKRRFPEPTCKTLMSVVSSWLLRQDKSNQSEMVRSENNLERFQGEREQAGQGSAP